MPFLIERIHSEEDGKQKARKFLNNVFSAYMLFMVLVSIIIAALMPYIAKYIAPGFSESQLQSLVVTSRIMLLSPIFIGLSNLIGTVTQMFKNFFIFSLSPIFYNVGILIGIFFLYPKFGVYGLSIGVIIGAILHLLVQIPIVVKHGFMPSFTWKINWREIFQVVRISAPRTFTLSCNSLAFMVLISMASTFKSGSISLFTFAYNIQSDPVSFIGISYAVAAFPFLAKSFSMKDMDNFIGQITQAARQIIFWSIPVTSLIIVLRAQIVRVVLGSNTFSWADTRLTAASTAVFMVALTTQGLVFLFVRSYYAAGNTKKPLLINVFSSAMVVVFAYIFIHIFKSCPSSLYFLENLLRIKNVPGTMILALPMAFALGSLLNFFLIWMLFKKDFLNGYSSQLFKTFIQSAISAIVMGVVAYLVLGVLDDILNINTGLGIFLQGFIAGIIGIIFGVFALALMKNRELGDLTRALSHKFWRNRVVAPEQKEL